MPDRDVVIGALWQAIASVSGVVRTSRNPSRPPKVSDMPAIQMFELDDKVIGRTLRGVGRSPSYKRQLLVAVESFIEAESDESSSAELFAFVNDLKAALYADGQSLGLTGVEFSEKSMSPVLRPPGLEQVAGIGILLEITYVEDISQLVGER